MRAPISIILPIPHWGSLAQQSARAVLDSISPYPDAEVILVAEAATVNATMRAGFGDRVRLIPTAAPFNFPAACNDGAAAARGEFFVFLAHDTDPLAGWLDALLAEARAHPEAAVIGSRILSLHDVVENAGFTIGQHGLPIARYRGFPADHPAISRSCRVTAVAAPGALIRREAFVSVSGFDTVYQETMYDVDLCLRLGKLGKETCYCASSTLYHFTTREPSDADGADDLQLFRDRWRHQVHPDDVQNYLDDGLLAFTYGESYPARIQVSPLLALPDQDAWDEAATSLLETRAQQMDRILREHTQAVIAWADDTARRSQTPIETMAKTKLQMFFVSGQRLTFPEVTNPRVSIVIPLYNQAHYTYLTLESLRATPVSVSFEVILVDDASTDATKRLLDRLDGVRIHTHEKNVGFGETCNDGIALARGEFICFLNSDIIATPGWLDALVEITEIHPGTGAVGAKLASPDGTLQEAGSTLWRDGSASGYGRGADPNEPEYSYARQVDYCSAACLLVRKDILDRIGGFDPRYSPAYYEDVDLCLRIWELGKSVWYAPHATVIHLEHASSGRQRAVALQMRNRLKLLETWPDLARDHGKPDSDPLRWRDRRPGKRVLVVDDLVPLMQIGSGFPRTAALLEALATAGYIVAYLPTADPVPHQPMTRILQARGVEVLHNRPDVLDQIAAHQNYYDIAIVSRPHNAPLIPRIRAANPDIKIIYDAEALFTLREANQSRMEGITLSASELARRIRVELTFVSAADLVFTVSNIERSAIEQYHPQVPIVVWGHAVEARQRVPGCRARTSVGFLGYLASAPNNDALLLLIEEVLPRVCSHGEMPFLVAGVGASLAVQQAAAEHHECVTLLGFIDDLSSFYDRCRVFVAPHRFAAGIPLKVVEAMANGVPCVISPLLAEQLGVTNEVEALVAADPEEFAQQIKRLYGDAALWQRIQRRAFRMIRERFDPEIMRETLRTQIDHLLAQPSIANGR